MNSKTIVSKYGTQFAAMPKLTPRDRVGNVRGIIRHVHANITRKLIFATSTPPHPDKPLSEEGWSWKQGDIERYNAAALEVMAEFGVPVNDLYRVIRADPVRLISEDQLHLSDVGKALCAAAVAQSVKECLNQ